MCIRDSDYSSSESTYKTGLRLTKDCAANKIDRDNIDKDVRVANKPVENTLSEKVMPGGLRDAEAQLTRSMTGFARALGMPIDPNAKFTPQKGNKFSFPDEDFE